MLLIGVAGTELSAQEREWLQHDAVAGVVLFKRNFASRTQVAELSAAIRAAAPRPVLICVDQEGGRVQRFREGFSTLAPLQSFGAQYAQDPEAALAAARAHAQLMASEVRASGVDLSFAPVVDLGRGNRAIGDRAFSDDPQIVATFTRAYVQALHGAGMAATLKHFPGHGTVLEDTHVDHASDPRPLEVLQAEDLVPFVAGIEAGADAVMMAHVVYPQVAPEPAGYSQRWIEQILRGQMGFRGVVFSDDIGMAASFSAAGGVAGRVHAHLDAGCDVVLVCHPELVAESLQAVQGRSLNTAALIGLIGRGALGWDGLLAGTDASFTTPPSAHFGTTA
ncbi:beta-N-acetylhexosaminidase [Xanthomonas phaseoli]|uniref:beta-N-acetylhexosaminidase n=1 Tax=Xanthomonas phaseoli TaxID=1985254 RepID=UPI00031E1540|nr:beta-N-acetylhexosaminidase [Xanthomonas phaseoli]